MLAGGDWRVRGASCSASSMGGRAPGDTGVLLLEPRPLSKGTLPQGTEREHLNATAVHTLREELYLRRWHDATGELSLHAQGYFCFHGTKNDVVRANCDFIHLAFQ